MCNGEGRIVSFEDETLLAAAGRDLAENGIRSIEALLFLLKEHSDHTWEHSLNVGGYGIQFAQQLGLPEPAVLAWGYAFALHDIGKLLIDKAIVNKAAKLSPEETATMRQHPLLGSQIIGSFTGLPASFRHVAKLAAFSHHEYWDGTGYPNGTKGSTISLIARAVLIADNFDAMIGSRPYRAGISPEEALANMEAKRNLYDPVLAPVFINMIRADLVMPDFTFLPEVAPKQQPPAATI